MSTIDRLVLRRRSIVRVEVAFLASIAIIAVAMLQVAF